VYLACNDGELFFGEQTLAYEDEIFVFQLLACAAEIELAQLRGIRPAEIKDHNKSVCLRQILCLKRRVDVDALALKLVRNNLRDLLCAAVKSLISYYNVVHILSSRVYNLLFGYIIAKRTQNCNRENEIFCGKTRGESYYCFEFFAQLWNILCDSIVNNVELNVAVFVDDFVPHTLDCLPGYLCVALFERLSQLCGILGYLYQAKKNRITEHLVLFRIVKCYALGFFRNKYDILEHFLDVIYVIFYIIHKSLSHLSVFRGSAGCYL